MREIEQLQKQWRDGARFRGLHASVALEKDGLVLGANTVLAKRNRDGALALDGEEAKLLTLLSVAHGRAIDASILKSFRQASDCAKAGDACMASMHVALALPVLRDPLDASRRLYVADGLLARGVRPRDIWVALEFDTAPFDALEKEYNPNQPRVPVGSGRPSGRWTSGDASSSASAIAIGAEPGAEWAGAEALSALRERAAATLGRLAIAAAESAARYAPPTAFLAALLYSSEAGGAKVQGPLRDFPDLTYARRESELDLNIQDAQSGKTLLTLHPQGRGIYSDSRTGVIAHMEGDELVIGPPAPPAVQSQGRADTKDPDLCPEPGLDLPGMIGRRGLRSKAYESYMKLLLNPDNPTPPGFGYQLPNPLQDGALVYYDDCHHPTGTMVEYKGLGYAGLINSLGPDRVAALAARWIRQAGRQVDAGEGRGIVWVFAEQRARDFAQTAFSTDPKLADVRCILVRPPAGNKWWKKIIGRFAWGFHNLDRRFRQLAPIRRPY